MSMGMGHESMFYLCFVLHCFALLCFVQKDQWITQPIVEYSESIV